MIGITAIKPYFEGKRTALEDLIANAELTEEASTYFEASGIEAIRQSKESGFALALGAAEQLLADEQIDPERIDLVIYIRGRIPDQLVSSEATRLQHALGATKAMVLSVCDLGCADSTMALKMAVDYLTANRSARQALVCYGHRNPESCRFRYPVTVQGDGGIACLLSKGNGHALLDFAFDFNGAYWDLFKIEYEGRRKESLREECRDLRAYGFELAVESRMKFQQCNQKLLDRHRLSYGDIDHILMQNISARAFEVYSQFLNHPISPVCRQNLSEYGHLGCADILLNLHLGLESGLFSTGQKLLIMNNSPVAAWTTLLLQVQST